jgi:hypothetical protein
MAPKQLRYDRMIDDAFRGVVRQALAEVVKNGLPGEHHFYITFETAHPGVDIPAHMYKQYPDTMTIVLQYQYWGLEVDDKKFEVTLSFNNRNERLVVPLAAITEFTDPSVGFKLAFQVRQEDEAMGEPPRKEPAAQSEAAKRTQADNNAADESKSAQVVALDAFRKK